MRILALLSIPLFAFGLASCSDGHDHDGKHAEDGEHRHTAPHGGTLVMFGVEFLHVELQLDATTGQLTAFVLGGEAEKPVRIAQDELRLTVIKGGTTFPVTLFAHASKLTGETVGNTSEFRGNSQHLVGVATFEGSFVKLVARGKTFEKIAFRFPEGNE